MASTHRTYLSQLVKVDLAHTDLPLPTGGGQWHWVRQTGRRLRLTERPWREMVHRQVAAVLADLVAQEGRP